MSAPRQDESNGGELSTSTVVAVCCLIALVLGAVTVLVVLGKPLDDLITIVGVIVAPTVGTLLAARKLDKANSVLKDVRVKVNGRLDALLAENAELKAEKAAREALSNNGDNLPTVELPALLPPPIPRPPSDDEYSVTAILDRINNDNGR